MIPPRLDYYDMGAEVVAFSSTRHGGCSKGNYAEFNINRYCGDDEADIRQNRQALCRLLGISDDRLLMPHQVHQTKTALIDEELLAHTEDERQQLLDTGGGLKKAAQLFTSEAPILVHNVDILSNMDLAAFYRSAVETQGQPATLLVSERQTQRYLLADAQDRLVGWTNIATGEVRTPYPGLDVQACKRVAFSGIQVFSPQLLPLMAAWEGKFSIIDFYLSVCHKVDIRLRVQPDLRLLDVGKLDSIRQAEHFLQQL